MTKEVRAFLAYIEKLLNENETDTDWEFEKEKLRSRIGFYQHERLIHLIVTMTFAVMTVLAFTAISVNIAFALLALLFLCLVIPYIVHYYFLENSVQALYKAYYKLEERAFAAQKKDA